MEGEALDSWRARIRPKPETEPQRRRGDEKEDAPVPLGSLNRKGEVVAESAISPERASLFPKTAEDVSGLFGGQIRSSAGLDSLIRDNPKALTAIQGAIESPAFEKCIPSVELSEIFLERATLLAKSTALGEVVSSGDRAALVTLFRSTGGTRWNGNENWDTDADLSEWRGVEVNDDGRVVGLWLSSNNLEGPLPEAVGALTELRYLRLNDNNLTGPIPEALGALKELTSLDLGRNKLTGAIPAWLGSLQKLQQLGLGANQLAGPMPEELGALDELTILWFDHNKLTGSIPTCLGSLSKLQSLRLNGNQLVGHLPKELGNSDNLRELHVENKHLTGGPAEGERLNSWRERICGKQATNPQTLQGDQSEEDAVVPPTSAPSALLRQQQEEGGVTLPMSSGDRAALVALFRSTCGTRWKYNENWDTDADLSQWYGVQVNEHGRVVKLDLSQNNVEGTIPEALGALTELKALYLFDNKLTGPIPEALGALKKLTDLWFDHNNLTGSIPTWLGSLGKLQGLWLEDNQLVGHVPKELGNLENLRQLHVGNNHLKGGPMEGEALDSWRARIRPKPETEPQRRRGDEKEDAPVPLGSLNRKGEVVAESATSPERASLFPKKAEEWSEDRAALVTLFQSTGGPGWNRNASWATDADLSKWHGVQVNDHGRVVGLRLSNNNLEGPIPEALGALKDLTHLGLGDNKLTGSIPTWLGSLGKLEILDLSGNQLVGPIPEALGALKELTHLFIGLNKLTGSIPKWLGSLSKLEGLELNDNQLVGTGDAAQASLIVRDLPVSTPTVLLMLGQGVIPTELGNLSALSRFEFGNNPPKSFWRRRKRLPGGPAEGEGLGAWRARMRLKQKTKPQTLNGDRMDEDAPVPPTSPPPALLPQQQDTDEGGKKDEVSPVPPTSPPPALLPQQQDIDEGGKKDEVSPVPPTSPPPVLVPQQQETDEGRKNDEVSPVPPTSPPPALLPQQQEIDEGGKNDEVSPVPPKSPPPVLLPQQQETDEGGKKDKVFPVPPTLLPQQQQTGEGQKMAEDPPVPPSSLNQRGEVVVSSVTSPERASSSPEQSEEVARLFRLHLSSSAGLDSLIGENPEALADIQRVIKAPVDGSLCFDDELTNMERRRKLGALVTMSTAIGEVVLSHTEDMDDQRKELALAPFSKAYYAAVRSGLCNAYLAASVIDSDWVSTSKTGGMGKAGAALKLVSSAVPVVGGLPELAGKALETGDHYLQTRRLAKITAMASDAMECCFLARRVALQLTDSVKEDTGMMDDEVDQVRLHTTAGMNGGSGSGRGADALPDTTSQDEVFEYLLEEVTSYERNDHGGKRLGKKHLRKLLKAIQGGCLEGSNCVEQKIKVLLLEILPDAGVRPIVTPSAPKEVIFRPPPVVAPAHDSGFPSREQFAAMQAALEALTSAKDKQQAELEALQSDKKKQQRELEALKSAMEEQQSKVEAIESSKQQEQAKLEALTSAKEKQHAELEALQSAKEMQQEELEALTFAKEEQQAELEALQFDKEQQKTELEGLASARDELERKVKKLENRVPELGSDPDDDVDFVGGLALRRRVAVTETAEGFLDRARDRAAGAAGHHPVTVSEQREFEALQDEKHREHDARFRELEGEISKAARRKAAAASDHDAAMTVNEHREFEALQNEKHREHEARFRELEGEISKAARRKGRG